MVGFEPRTPLIATYIYLHMTFIIIGSFVFDYYFVKHKLSKALHCHLWRFSNK
jgi:hypothetical protein